MKLTKEELGWPLEPRFYIPDDVLAHFRQAVERGKALEAEYAKLWEGYRKEYPAEAAELQRYLDGELPTGWEEALPVFPADKPVATRNASGTVINALAKTVTNLMGGSADRRAAPTMIMACQPGGRVWRAQHALRRARARHGGHSQRHGAARRAIPYGGTFWSSAIICGSMRLSALMGVPVVYVLTHDTSAWARTAYAPAHRTSGLAARHSQHDGDPPGRRQRGLWRGR